MKGTTRKQFFDELTALRQRVLELESAAAQRQREVTALQRAAERQEMVCRILTAALEEHTPDAIAQLALSRLKELVPYRSANVALFDYEARQAKILAAMMDRGDTLDAGTQYALETLGEEKIRALERGETVHGEDDAGSPLGPQVARPRHRQVPAYLGVPLAVASAPIGVLNVWAAHSDGFTYEHIETIHAMAGALSAAIHQAGQREQMQRHARELVALYNASQAMVSVLDFQPVLKTVITEAKTLLQAEMASVLLRSGDWLVFEASVGPGAEAVVGTRIPINAGIAGWVMREQQPVRVSEAHKDPRFYAIVDRTTGLVTRSVLAVPLIAKGTLSGVIEVINKIVPDDSRAKSQDAESAGAVFYEQDLEILMALASPAAIAIENARSYQAELELSMSLQSSQAKAILHEKMAALGRFAATLDQSIGQRFASIETALNLAQRDVHLPARRGKLASYLRMIEQDVRQIDNVVSQLHQFHQPAESGHVATDIRVVLDRVLASAEQQLRQAGVTVERRWAQDLPPIQADPEQLQQAFLNLVSNAINAMLTQRRGKLAVRLNTSQMRVSHEPGAGPVPALQIDLSDTGSGIPPEILPRLFEPFVTTKENSPGLGLSMSYRIIQAHHGQITVTSKPGLGTTFTVLLPV